MNQALEMARVAYQALDEKKGEDIRVIDISGISVIGDYFVITKGFCTAPYNRNFSLSCNKLFHVYPNVILSQRRNPAFFK